VEQGIVSLGNSLFRPVPPELLEDELLDAARLDDAAAGAALEDVGGTDVEVGVLELVVDTWKNSAASVEEEEDALVLVEDVVEVEVVLSGTSM
jgi:hypothetical protein